MELDLGASVHAQDRRNVGKVSKVVLDPRSNEIVDLIVHAHSLLRARDIVVPVSAAVSAGKGHVELRLTADGLERLPDFVEREYLPVPPEWFAPAPFPPGGLLWPAGTAATVLTEGEVRNVPPGTVEIAEGMDVACPDGRIGDVDEVVIDAGSRQVRGLVVRRGAILGQDVFIPAEWIAGVTGGRVVLNRTKAEVEHLAELAAGQ